MMVWRKQGRHTFTCWIYPLVGERVEVSTGVDNEQTARQMVAWVDDIVGRGDLLGVVAAIASKTLKLSHAYHLGEQGSVLELDRLRAVALQADAVNVWPHLIAYAKQRSVGKKPVRSAETSLAMARHVFPEDPCPHTLWENADEIERRLTTLQGKTWKGKARAIGDATRNRYRNALSVQAEHLRRLKIIARNPLHDVQAFAESPLSFSYLELPDAKTLIEALDAPGQVCAALALGFGMELSAMQKAEVRDLDVTQWVAHSRGSKAHTRDRVVPLSDVFAFLKPILLRAVKGQLPRARLVTVPEYTLLDRQKKTALALGIQPITLHQWRHSCAVILLQHHEAEATVAHILGHKDTALVHKRYGRFRFRAEHMVTRAGSTSAAGLTAARATGND